MPNSSVQISGGTIRLWIQQLDRWPWHPRLPGCCSAVWWWSVPDHRCWVMCLSFLGADLFLAEPEILSPGQAVISVGMIIVRPGHTFCGRAPLSRQIWGAIWNKFDLLEYSKCFEFWSDMTTELQNRKLEMIVIWMSLTLTANLLFSKFLSPLFFTSSLTQNTKNRIYDKTFVFKCFFSKLKLSDQILNSTKPVWN